MPNDRDIWFERILWSYMPCHWKGWFALVVFSCVTLSLIFITEAILEAIALSKYTDFADIWFIAGFIWMMRFSKRHSTSR